MPTLRKIVDPDAKVTTDDRRPTTDDRPLPLGWVWTTIGEIAETTSGGTPSRKHLEYFGGTIPWVKSGELGDSVITAVEEFITKEGLQNSNAKIFPQGTALVALYGATVGKTGILALNSATNQAVCAVFPLQNAFIAKFVTYWLQSQRQKLIDLSVGGAQPNISQGVIRSFPIPLPPLAEQQCIVAEVERRLSVVAEVEAAVAANLKRAGRLRQSILKRAFEGKLVPQDPSDEPAGVLLERIRREREGREDKKGTRQLRMEGM